jgi:hypothetical protein
MEMQRRALEEQMAEKRRLQELAALKEKEEEERAARKWEEEQRQLALEQERKQQRKAQEDAERLEKMRQLQTKEVQMNGVAALLLHVIANSTPSLTARRGACCVRAGSGSTAAPAPARTRDETCHPTVHPAETVAG